MSREPVEIDVEIQFLRDTSVVVFDGRRQARLPLSQIAESLSEADVQAGRLVTLTIPRWLAEDRGLV